MTEFILASQSPRRRDLLGLLDIPFEIIPALGSEDMTEQDPALLVEDLSLQKAREVAGRLAAARPGHDLAVIGADTVVAIDGQILGKPAGYADAAAMIESLQGRTHHVFTGCSLIHILPDGQRKEKTFHVCTEVHVCPMSEEEIRAYCQTKEPYDKAGAYGIQGRFGVFIEGISGDYNNVVGLPVARLYQEMKEMGLLR